MALALSPPLLHFSLPYPDCQSLVTASLLLVVDGHDDARPRPHSPATSSASSISLRSRLGTSVVDDRSLNRLTSYLFASRFYLRFSHRERKLEFIVGRGSCLRGVRYDDSGTVLWNWREKNSEAEFFFFRKLLQTWLIGSLYSIRVNVISKKHFVSFHSIV